MTYFCDICQKPLIKSGNDLIYFCNKQEEWLPNLNRKLSYYHCINNYNENGKNIFKIITVPPYVFEIDYINNKTKIKKIILFIEKTLKKTIVTIAGDNIEEEVYFEVPTVLSLPWNDLRAIEEKLKLYNLFY